MRIPISSLPMIGPYRGSLIVWLLCVTVGFAQTPQPRTIHWGSAASDQSFYYGIIGEVSQPGVYSSTSPSSLQDVVSAANGLLATASPSIRIIRQDHSGQIIFFRPTGHDLLQNGDFILVDELRGVVADGDWNRRQAPGVWIGLMGVSPRPVVVPFNAEWANLPAILTALGQDSALANTVRMVLPHHAGPIQNAATPIPSGSIIALPTARIVAANLPEFPAARPIKDLPIPRTSQPFLTNTPQLTATDADFGPPSPVAPAPPTRGVTENSQSTVPLPLPTSPAVPADRDVAASILPYSTPGRIDTSANPASMPLPGSRLATILDAPTANVPKQPAAVSVPAAPLTRSHGNKIDESSLWASNDKADLVGEPAVHQSKEPNPFSLWHLLGISGTVASLVGVALGTRRLLEPASTAIVEEDDALQRSSRLPKQWDDHSDELPESRRASMGRQPTGQKPVSHSAREAAVPLPALLSNQIPLLRELADLPVGVSLQRPQLEASLNFRLDARHEPEIGRPHFKFQPGPPPEVTLEIDAASDVNIPKPHFRPTAPLPSMKPKPVKIDGALEKNGSLEKDAQPPKPHFLRSKASATVAEKTTVAEKAAVAEKTKGAEKSAMNSSPEDRLPLSPARVRSDVNRPGRPLAGVTPVELALSQIQRGRRA